MVVRPLDWPALGAAKAPYSFVLDPSPPHVVPKNVAVRPAAPPDVGSPTATVSGTSMRALKLDPGVAGCADQRSRNGLPSKVAVTVAVFGSGNDTWLADRLS